MHDYSRDIMLANAQSDMEVNLKKMQLAQKVSKIDQYTLLQNYESLSLLFFLLC